MQRLEAHVPCVVVVIFDYPLLLAVVVVRGRDRAAYPPSLVPGDNCSTDMLAQAAVRVCVTTLGLKKGLQCRSSFSVFDAVNSCSRMMSCMIFSAFGDGGPAVYLPVRCCSPLTVP